MKLARHIELHDAREGNEAVEHGTPVTTSQSEPGGGLANTREGQMELLPCPFCGKTPILSSRPGINHCGRDWSIQCATPGCFNFVTTSSRYRSELIATWNKRPPSLPAVPDVKEEEKYDSLGRIRAAHANTAPRQMELDLVVKELVASCNDALGYFEAILETSAFIGERGAVESKINRLKAAIESARGVPSDPEWSKSEAGSEFPQSQFGTGGRNALNLQMALDEINSVLGRLKDELDSIKTPYPSPTTEAMRLLSISMFKDMQVPLQRAVKCLSENGPKSSNATGVSSPSLSPSSSATVREQMEPRVHRVAIQLCELCLEGKPGECHTPGCALFLHDSPGHPILPELYEILVPSGIVEQPKKETDLGEKEA